MKSLEMSFQGTGTSKRSTAKLALWCSHTTVEFTGIYRSFLIGTELEFWRLDWEPLKGDVGSISGLEKC